MSRSSKTKRALKKELKKEAIFCNPVKELARYLANEDSVSVSFSESEVEVSNYPTKSKMLNGLKRSGKIGMGTVLKLAQQKRQKAIRKGRFKYIPSHDFLVRSVKMSLFRAVFKEKTTKADKIRKILVQLTKHRRNI